MIGIVGAGPAGAMAAVRLARAGAPVAIFDPSHPREKPCGGGLTARALALVADVVDVASLPSVDVTSAIVEPPARARESTWAEAAEVTLTGEPTARHTTLVVLSRAIFDRALADAAIAAGARLIPEKVIGVRRHRSRFCLSTVRGEYEVDQVLGADGPNSIVRKTLAAPFSRDQLSVASGYFVHGVSSSSIAIRTMREQPGYLWSFPRPDHLAVGVCAPAALRVSSVQLRAQTRGWIETHGFERGATLTQYAWPIPSVGGSRAREITFGGPGWMLAGDAAGLVDPLTREGIYYALLSGAWAAEALSSGAGGASAQYSERLRAEVQPELARAASLSGAFFSPAFASLLVRALRDSAPVRDVFVDLVTGAQPYRGLRRRLLATREWALAGRAIRMLLTPGFAGTMKPAVLSQETTRS